MNAKRNYFFPIIKPLVAVIAISSIACLSACDDDEPTKEDTPELITKVILTFTPMGGGSAIQATASDPDGTGVQDLATDGPISLEAKTTYTLQISLVNELADPSEAAYDITREVREEGDEHMLFFSWTQGLFSDPAGNGNVDNRADDVNYIDEDDNGQPIGLNTTWTTADAGSGTFRVVLKHQPELKSPMSTSAMGETDLDLQFDVDVQ